MTYLELSAKVKKNLGEGKIREALELLLDFIKGHDRYIENDLVTLKASFYRISRERMVLSTQEYGIEETKVIEGANNILDRIADLSHIHGTHISDEIDKSPTMDASPSPAQKKILFLTANPIVPGYPRLNLDTEIKRINRAFEQASHVDQFEIIFETSAKIHTITQAMRKHKPQIVYFTGYGSGNGLYVEGQQSEMIFFPLAGLKRLFKVSKHVEIILLNTAFSSDLAKTISEYEIHAIGMNDEIGEITAGEFAAGFFQSIGEGDPVDIAYEIAMVNIAHRTTFAKVPELWFRGDKIGE
ncbi:MAG: hypothetical protein AAF587_15515 [Bacteroidota bacterium]